MSGTPTSHRLAHEALDEHQQIHFYLDQVAASLEALQPGLTEEEPMRRLAAQMAGLQERLTEHHDLEERGGLFRMILDALPEARVEISRLIRQHEKMIEILEMARIHAQRGDPAEAVSLRADLERFMQVFRSHELEEEQLIRDVMARESRTP